MPVALLVYGLILDMGVTATGFMVLKQAINGIFNALVASVVINYSPLHRCIASPSDHRIVSLQETLFHVLVAFVLLPSLLILFQESGEYARSSERATVESLKDLAARFSSHLKVWHKNRLSSVEQLASVAEKNGLVVSTGLQHDLEIIVKSDRNSLGFFVANSEGTTVVHTPLLSKDGISESGLNFAARPYFQEMRANARPVTSEVIEGYGNLPARIITISVPILKDGQFTSCATAVLDLERILELVTLSSDESNQLSKNITLTGRDGQVLASSVQGLEAPRCFNPEQNESLRQIADSVFIYTPDGYKDLPTVTRWKHSFYTIEKSLCDDIPWTLIIESPVAPLQEDLFRKQSQVFLTAEASRAFTPPKSRIPADYVTASVF